MTSPATTTTWVGAQGAAAFDLRSDTMTTPTASMLAAIQTATLLDDVEEEDGTTRDLEARVAQLTGKEAALFVLSGTMGNQVALRSLLTQPPYSVLCDARGHIVNYEGGGVSSLTGAMTVPILPANGEYLTVEDIAANAVLDDEEGDGDGDDGLGRLDPHACPTRVVSLENTLDGLVMPLREARRIADWCRERGVLVHCDGARLWEAAVAVAVENAAATPDVDADDGAAEAEKASTTPSRVLRQYADCFDTLTLCFSKGLGAPVGSILAGPRRLVRHARRVRKALGGGLRQPGVVTAAARVALDETFLGMPSSSPSSLPPHQSFATQGHSPPLTNGGGAQQYQKAAADQRQGQREEEERGGEEAPLLRSSHRTAQRVADLWLARGGRLAKPRRSNMAWLDLRSLPGGGGVTGARFKELGAEHGLRLGAAGRVIAHYQVGDEALRRLERVFDALAEEAKANPALKGQGQGGPLPPPTTSRLEAGGSRNLYK